jgi:serpin B
MNQKCISISIISLLLISFVLFLSGCGQQKTIPVDQTGSTSGGINTVVEGNNQFAFDLYSKFKNNPENENIFFSPYSISVALTMTYEGAKGKTAEEMQSVLHIPEDKDLRRSNFAAIYNGINKNDKEYKLSTANALWAQKGYPFLDDYLETVEKYYGGKATNLDMSSEPEKSRKIINDWVEEQTNDKIKDLIPPGVLPVRLVLTNAIYFKGDWIYQFDKKATRDSDFYKNEQERIQVPMMSMTNEEAEFNYAETEDLQILELPYKGEELSMLVLLPKENDIDSLEQNLNINKLSEWKNMLEEQSVDVF